MKLLTYRYQGIEAVGILLDADRILPVKSLGYDFPDMQTLIENTGRQALKEMSRRAGDWKGETIPRSRTEPCPPIPMLKRDMICIGYNFKNHAEEIAKLRGESIESAKVSYPIYFSKRILYATGDRGAVPYFPTYAHNLDCGVEVCAVIGREAKNILPEETDDYIFGYTIANDMTDTRLNKAYTQPFLGKSVDGYMPVGPWIVTADEFPPHPTFEMELTVNGKLRQSGNTRDLVFSIPYIVSELSTDMTLKPGTMIETGSPANLDAGNPEKLLLRPGDEMVCRIGGIGTLTNPIVECREKEGIHL